MRKLLHNDTAIRVISVLVSILLWMYVVGVNNPTVSVVLKGIPVQIANSEQFDNSGLKVISVANKTIDVKVEGRHSDVANVSASDIAVNIDVSKITKPGKYDLSISLKSDSSGVTFTNITATNTSVFADYVVAVNKDIAVKTDGEPKDNFFVDDVSSADTQVLVRGPKSIVDGISGAAAYISIQGADSDFSKGCSLSIVDSNGKEVDLTYITTNITETVVDVKFINTKTVKIMPVFENQEILSDFDIEISPDSVKISGSAGITKNIDKLNTVVIAADKTVLLEDETQITVDAALELPEGIMIADDEVTSCKVILTAK